MPITQTRVISLLNEHDTIIQQYRDINAEVHATATDAITAYKDGNLVGLTSAIQHIAALTAKVNEPVALQHALERQHFRANKRRNERHAAKAAQSRLHGSMGPRSTAPKEAPLLIRPKSHIKGGTSEDGRYVTIHGEQVTIIRDPRAAMPEDTLDFVTPQEQKINPSDIGAMADGDPDLAAQLQADAKVLDTPPTPEEIAEYNRQNQQKAE